ncbi:MAG: class I SAM-dependent methyltransferase [Saprospiraceae bacterium]|nr:class I SAM-dependent methyltransferase [Saprospiraceae bacterium]
MKVSLKNIALQAYFYRILRFLKFYLAAVTKYQLHSPFVFELTNAVLEDARWFYAFRDVERVRQQMLASEVRVRAMDSGQTASATTTIRAVVRRAASSPRQGQLLFRLACWASPRTMLELGTSLGIGAMYLASGMRSARFVSLEGSADFAQVARANLETLGLSNVEILVGAFADTLPTALARLPQLDLVFFDGHHQLEPTLRYLETCLPHSHAQTVFVFDDVYWSPDMTRAWEHIRQHPRVTLTIDFFEVSLAFVNPDFKEKQHYKVVPKAWKPWKVF